MRSLLGRHGAPGGDPVRDLVGLAVRVFVGMAIFALLVAIIVGVATAGFAILGLLVAVTVVAQVFRWISGRVRRGTASHVVTSIHREDRVDPTTGKVRRTTVIDVD
jgi:hypothetical protein